MKNTVEKSIRLASKITSKWNKHKIKVPQIVRKP